VTRSAYRDQLHGVRTRVEERLREAAEREDRLTELLWESLPPELAARLRELRGTSEPSRDTLHELTRADGVLEAYLHALEETIELAPSLELERRSLPESAPDPKLLREPEPPLWRRLREVERMHTESEWLGERLRGILRRLDPRARFERLGLLAERVRFRARGAPMSLLCELRLRGDTADYDLALATSVSSGTPRLSLRSWTWTHALLKSLLMVLDVDVGDDEFDALFLVDAQKDVAVRLLSPDVRLALRALSYYDMPTLDVGCGVALLRWSYEPTAAAVDAGARALAGIRAATFDVPLLKPEPDE
jgi:hypothetical protein